MRDLPAPLAPVARTFVTIVRRSFATVLKLTASAIWVLSNPASAADTYQTGSIVNVTTTKEGLMVMLDSGLPTNCAATSFGWMLIPEANKTMVAATLALWLTGRTLVTVYVDP